MKRYSIYRVFQALQGEGTRAGTRAVFVRFAGCNLWAGSPETRATSRGACGEWCDEEFRASFGQRLTANELIDQIDQLWPRGGGLRWVCMAGGEPLLQLDGDLVAALTESGLILAIETNGTVEPKPGVMPFLAHVCVSPKLLRAGPGHLVAPDLAVRQATDLKVVLPGGTGEHPGWTDEQLLALGAAGRWGTKLVVPMDPTWHQTSQVSGRFFSYHEPPALVASVEQCKRFVHEHPEWRIGLQTHKMLDIE